MKRSSWSGVATGVVAATTLSACAPSLPPVGPSDLQVVLPLRPWVTREGLSEGRRLFAQRCAACHRLPDPASHPAEKWPVLVEWMRDRSHLDTAQGRQVADWVVARSGRSAQPAP